MTASKGFRAQTVRWEGNVWWKVFFTREVVEVEMKCILKPRNCPPQGHCPQ